MNVWEKWHNTKNCEICGEDIGMNRQKNSKYCKTHTRYEILMHTHPNLHVKRDSNKIKMKKELFNLITNEFVHSPMLIQEFLGGCEVSERSARNYLVELVEEGRVEQKGELTGRYYRKVEVI